MNLKSTEIKLRNLGDDVVREWEQLVVSENMLSKIYNSSSDLMGVLTVDDDDDFTFVHANEKTLQNQKENKIPPDLYFNTKLTTYLSDVTGQPEKRVKEIQKIYQRVAKSGKPSDFDTEVWLPNGANLVFNTALNPIMEDGVCTHIIFATSDVTERRNVDRLRKASEEGLRVFLESSSDAAAMLSSEYNIIDVSEGMAQLLRKPREELIGANMWELLPPDVSEKRKKWFQIVAQTKEKVVFEDNNRGHYFVNSVNPVFDSKGEIEKYAISAMNVTDKVLADIALKKAREEAERKKDELYQASKMATLGTLVSGIAHEINNPNNNIMVNSSLLMKFLDDIIPVLNKHYDGHSDFKVGGLDYPDFAGSCHRLIESINSGSHRIKNTVNKLKNYSRKESIIERQSLNINEVIFNASELMMHRIKKSTNNFSFDKNESVPKIQGHFLALEQVMVNLIENACQALKSRDGYIKIECKVPKGAQAIQVIVSDNGSGINPEVVEKIKDPFFTTRRSLGGMGLGLSISASIIEDHKGKLEFQSEPDVLTKAIVTLPL